MVGKVHEYYSPDENNEFCMSLNNETQRRLYLISKRVQDTQVEGETWKTFDWCTKEYRVSPSGRVQVRDCVSYGDKPSGFKDMKPIFAKSGLYLEYYIPTRVANKAEDGKLNILCGCCLCKSHVLVALLHLGYSSEEFFKYFVNHKVILPKYKVGMSIEHKNERLNKYSFLNHCKNLEMINCTENLRHGYFVKTYHLYGIRVSYHDIEDLKPLLTPVTLSEGIGNAIKVAMSNQDIADKFFKARGITDARYDVGQFDTRAFV